MSVIAGIDYSMTCPAICIYDTDQPLIFDNLKLFALSSGAKKHIGVKGNISIEPQQEFDSPEIRYRNIANWAVSILIAHRVKEVCLEGYSMGSSAGLVFNIAENTSVLKQKLYDAGIKFTTPAPTAVKKQFFGKGNAKKPEMCDEFVRRFGVKMHQIIDCPEAKSPENDLVDATANMLTHRLLVKP